MGKFEVEVHMTEVEADSAEEAFALVDRYLEQAFTVDRRLPFHYEMLEGAVTCAHPSFDAPGDVPCLNCGDPKFAH